MFAIISYGFSDYSSSEKIYLHLVIPTKLACVCIQSTFLLFRRQQVILLVAMIAAIAITLKGRKADVKGQNPSEQVVVEPTERLSLVKLTLRKIMMIYFFFRKSHEPNALFISRFHFVCNIRARNFYQSSEYDHFVDGD